MIAFFKKLLSLTLKMFFEILVLTLIVYSVIFWMHFKGVELIIEKVRASLQNRISARILYKNYEVDYFNGEIVFKDICFYRRDLTASLKSIKVKFRLPNIFSRSWPIKELILEEPYWKVLRDNNRCYVFPDFIMPQKKESIIEFPVEKITFKNFKFYFQDETVSPIVKTEFGGSYFIIVIDRKNEKMLFKGYLNPFFAEGAEVFINYEVEFKKFLMNYYLKVSGKNLKFSEFTPYHYEISKLKNKGGRGILDLTLDNHLGVLDGYLYIKIKDPVFEAFKESIFSTMMGLSRKGFLNLVKENNDEIILDFYIHGTSKEPGLKLGNFSKNFFTKAPVTIAKGSIVLVEKVFNTLLLGIPRKVYRAGKLHKKKKEDDEGFSIKDIQP